MDKAFDGAKTALFIFVKAIGILILAGVVLCILDGVFGLYFLFGGNRHEKARQTTCSSNEKQIGLAIYQYVQDNDGNLPNIADAKDPNTTWRTMVYPYVKSTLVFLCPDHDSALTAADGFPISYAANFTGSYSGGVDNLGNGAFAGPGSRPIHRNNIEHPESLIMLCEVSHTERPEFNIDALAALDSDSNVLWAGHNSGSNYLMFDGHVRYMPAFATKDMWHRDSSIPLLAGAMTILKNAGERDGK